MKKVQVISVILFFAILLLPIALFNFEENVVSEIDNRQLADNPFGENADNTGDLTADIENYIQDRIGLRDEMIYSYTILNDRIFGNMVHPSYEYGKEGYVFLAGNESTRYTEYHEAFANMVSKIQSYCEARGVPFLFAFNPSKKAIYTDKLAEGTVYDRSWVDDFFASLDDKDVNYVNNTEILRQKTAQGEIVFNRQYNAGHWNDLGAFYGANNILEAIKKQIPGLHINTLDEFSVEQKLNTTLMLSKFPINEYEPIMTCIDTTVTYCSDLYTDELEINNSYRHFSYAVNEKRLSEGAPRALVFQGSYMNGMGYKFLENSFGEYIAVHDYQNILNFDYYFNIFDPEVVIFEVAEYTFYNTYFDYEGMCNFALNSDLDSFDGYTVENKTLSDDHITVLSGNTLTNISLNIEPADYMYLSIDDKNYDVDISSATPRITLPNEAVADKEFTATVIDTKNKIKKIYS